MSYQMNLTCIVYIIYYTLNSIHSGRLPVLSIIVIHSNDSDLIAYLHN